MTTLAGDYLCQFGVQEVADKRFLSDYFRGKCIGVEARGELYNDGLWLGDARLCGITSSLYGMGFRSEQSLKLNIMLHVFLLLQSGLTILCGGDELGQLNDYSYQAGPIKRDEGCYLHWGNLDWTAAQR